MLKNLILAATVLFCKTLSAQSPESYPDSIRQHYTNEKIFIHYDKSAYLSGETVWFKAYLAEGIFPSTESTVLNVELLNDSGRVIQRKILPVISSFAAGNFDLPASLPGGAYNIKAYTRRMMNFGTENFYYYSLNIYRPGSLRTQASVPLHAQMKFLPESGNLIGKIKNTVAFKCTDDLGYPLAAAGIIKDASGKEIVKFKTVHDGMGRFDFVPVPGEKYTARYSIGATDSATALLPDISFDGALLSVKRKGDSIFFEVSRNNADNNSFAPAYLLGVEENTVVFKTPLPGGSKMIGGMIPVDQLSSGILQLTVFNSDNKPLAERLIFINSEDYILGGNLLNPKRDLAARAENSFLFEAADTSLTTYSVAVTDMENADIDASKTDDIVSRFLLSAELRGRIINPAYYFESNNEEHRDNLDLVMMTNGWRRYSWNEILTGRFPSMSFKDMNYLSVSGTAYDPAMGQPLSNIELSLFIRTKDNESDFQTVSTDAQGRFTTGPMLFEDSARLSFQINRGKHPKVNIVLNTLPLINSTYVVPSRLPQQPFTMVSDLQAGKINNMAAFLHPGSDGILLDEVKIKTKVKSASEKYAQQYVTGTLGGNAEHTLDFLANPPTEDGSNILEHLKSKLGGVDISGGPIDYSVIYRQSRSIGGGPIQMTLYLDATQTEASMISTIPTSQVAMVKVYSASAMTGSGGALAIFTKKGENGYISPDSQLSIFKIEGFSPAKEYFSPDYSKDSDIRSDDRTTLYWNPYLVTDSKHPKINISFYNSDHAKKIRVIINGMSADGKLLFIEKIIE